jgi:hypothetical protein
MLNFMVLASSNYVHLFRVPFLKALRVYVIFEIGCCTLGCDVVIDNLSPFIVHGNEERLVERVREQRGRLFKADSL